MMTFNTAHRQLKTHLLDQVLVRFDFPPVLSLASPQEGGTLKTVKVNSFLVEVQNEIKENLPKYKMIQEKNLNVDISNPDKPIITTDIPNEIIHRFSDEQENINLEIGYNHFVFFVKGTHYSGFNKFVDSFWAIWEKLQKKLKIKLLNRVGVRKIDHLIEKGSEKDSLEKLIFKLRMPFTSMLGLGKILPSFGNSAATFESLMDDNGIKRIFQFGTRRGMNEGKPATLLFLDFDVFKSNNIENDDVKNLISEKINLIHWEMFLECLNDETLRNLEREE